MYSHQNLFALICIYYLSFLWFFASSTNKRIFYKWNIVLNDWFICKVNNNGNFCRYMPLVDIYDLSNILFSVFLSDLVFSKSKILIALIPSYSFSSLNWFINLRSSLTNRNREAYPYQKTILENITILMSWLTHLDFVSVLSHYIVTYDTHCIPEDNLFRQHDHTD